MRAVVQRVDGQVVSAIGPGLLCLVGVRDGDGEAQAEWLARRILGVRLWSNEAGGKAWDQSVVARGYEVLCVSQFTLCGRLKGNKPDFTKAMPPGAARDFYGGFLARLRRDYAADRVKDGVFGAMMQVQLVNDGPVTMVLDSEAGPDSSMGSISSLDA
eukprot:scaffold4.g4923.t1